jgi:hypothetical protein
MPFAASSTTAMSQAANTAAEPTTQRDRRDASPGRARIPT